VTESALTERKTLKIFMTGAGSAAGLGAVKALVGGGHKVTGTVKGSREAAWVRELGGLPIVVDLTRQSEIEAVMRMAQPDVVVNLGTQDLNQAPFAPIKWDGTWVYSNAVATLEAAVATGVKFFVHGSFAFVYGDQHGHWVDETTRAHADNDLIKAALRAEKTILTAQIPACVLRFGYVYSAGSPGVLALIDALRRGRSTIGGDGILNWVYVTDAGEAVRRAAEAQPIGDIFNIVDTTPTNASGFMNKLAESMGLRSTGRLSEFMARRSFNKTQLELLKHSTKARNARARETLGWMPQYPDQIHGLEDILLTWRATEGVR
jgi:nucleoside-diphosphate-sugar epimerase